MVTAFIAAAAAIGGAFIGYWLRVLEFRREHRLRTYAAFIAAFLDAAHVGAGMLAAYIVQGDAMLRSGLDPEIDLGRERLGEALQTFEAATAEVRMVASPKVRTMSEEAEDFLQVNVRNVPPLRHPHSTRPAEGWGVAAQVGPTRVDTDATLLARRFGDVAAVDVSGGICRRLHRHNAT